MKSSIAKVGLGISVCTMLIACGRSKVETKPIRKDITEIVFASGTLIANEQYYLKAKTDGYLQNVNFEEGDVVASNQLLAVIDNSRNQINSQSAKLLLKISAADTSSNAPALQQIKASIKLAKEKLKQDALQFQRYKKLYESLSVSKLEYENIQLAYETSASNLEALEQSYANAKKQAKQQFIAQESLTKVSTVSDQENSVRAVKGGKIYQKLKQNGDFVSKGETIAVIGVESSMYAKLNVDETSIEKIKLGQKVFIQFNTDTTKTYNATIWEILPSFDGVSQSFACKAKFTQEVLFKIANTQLQANILIGRKPNALLIPRNFLMYGGKVMLKDKSFRKVKTGIVSNEWVEILEGLTQDDSIIEESK